MRLLSLFSGIGGLDVAVERAFGATVVAHCEADPFCRRVLARHWPAVPCYPDVCALTAAQVGAVDIICGGFPCTDLSVAGKQEGLSAARSGLWFEYLRLVRELRPGVVVIENVPPLYRKLAWRRQVQEPLEALGYRVIWTLCKASDVGAPHRRERTFALAVRPGVAVPVVSVAPVVSVGRRYPTPIAGDSKSTGNGNCLTLTDVVVRGKEWPTPTSSEANGAGRASGVQGGDNLRTAAAWSTPTATDSRDAPDDGRLRPIRVASGRQTDYLHREVLWGTPRASDEKGSGPVGSASHMHRLGKGYLDAQAKVGAAALNPAWVEPLMGLPTGWTLPDGEPMAVDFAPRWPAVRGQPQHAWEPPRVVAHKDSPNRRARLKALGNAVVPQQAMLALARLTVAANDATRSPMGKAQGVLL